MIGERKILAVVPARCGSKGVPLKNIREVNGKPLVALVGGVVEQLSEIDRVVVSTDCDEVAEVAIQAGLDVPFRRPESLSGDLISDLDVLTSALIMTEKLDDVQYDIICMLQPTCPFRTPVHVKDTIVKLIKGNFDAVWTVSETDSKAHPLKQLIVSDDDEMNYYDERGAEIIARQQLEPVYHRNGAAYAITRDCLIDKKSIKGDRPGVVVIHEQLVNIDTEQDLEYCSFLAGRYS